jgi:molybdate transport system substrate-binding protein
MDQVSRRALLARARIGTGAGVVMLLLALALLTALTTSATAEQGRATAQMNVFAAASLTEAFPKFDGGQKYNFAGSDALAAQIRLGAPADIFAAAGPDAPRALYKDGLVERPVTFATNKLVLAVPTANPAAIRSIYDIERPGVKLLIGTPSVPVGAYTRQVLGYLGITSAVMANVVSQEKDVKAISSKFALGTADAGFMYATDARAVSHKVKLIPVPAWAQPPVRYQIAIVKSTQNHADAAAFIKRLTSTAGRKLLVANGFGVPKLPPVKTPPKK